MSEITEIASMLEAKMSPDAMDYWNEIGGQSSELGKQHVLEAQNEGYEAACA